ADRARRYDIDIETEKIVLVSLRAQYDRHRRKLGLKFLEHGGIFIEHWLGDRNSSTCVDKLSNKGLPDLTGSLDRNCYANEIICTRDVFSRCFDTTKPGFGRMRRRVSAAAQFRGYASDEAILCKDSSHVGVVGADIRGSVVEAIHPCYELSVCREQCSPVF